jgi:hypothetical protein
MYLLFSGPSPITRSCSGMSHNLDYLESHGGPVLVIREWCKSMHGRMPGACALGESVEGSSIKQKRGYFVLMDRLGHSNGQYKKEVP